MQSIMPLMMLMNGKGSAPGESQAMEQMLPMLLMMMDETEITDDGEVVSINVCSESFLMSQRLWLIRELRFETTKGEN